MFLPSVNQDHQKRLRQLWTSLQYKSKGGLSEGVGCGVVWCVCGGGGGGDLPGGMYIPMDGGEGGLYKAASSLKSL